MGRTHDVLISEFDLDRLESQLPPWQRTAAEQTRRANENHARALRAERERDEARERADTMFAKHADILDQYRRERDAERALAEQRGRLYDTAIRQLKALERDLDRLEAQLDAERALADRLAGMLELYYADDAIAHYAGIADALTAWKEARSE